MSAIVVDLIGAVVACTVTILATGVVDLIIKAPGYNGESVDNFDGKRFHDFHEIKTRTLLDVFKWTVTKDPGEWEELGIDDIEQGCPPADPPKQAISITFVNHSSFLIQTGGLNILTDPIWSKRASPFQWIGPKRMRPPGIAFEDLPEIDLVLLSHNHYDHLDIHTVKRLSKRNNPLFVAPLGVAQYLHKNGVTNTKEFKWWQEEQLHPALKLSAVPSQHFSGRGLSDRDKTLWCGYVLQTNAGTLYFVGDTGYDTIFTDIGKRFSIDVSLIPIGAYEPRWFMEPIHVDPEQALQIHKDINSTQSIGMHFGTFPLADEGMNQPKQDLAAARQQLGIAESEFGTLKEGATKTFHTRAVKK